MGDYAKGILKYSYLGMGIFLFIGVNIFSYTNLGVDGDIFKKLLFSAISFVLLIINYMSILFTKRLYKRDFVDFTRYTKVTMYLGVIIIPLISLYY